jgi:hypothetical protein
LPPFVDHRPALDRLPGERFADHLRHPRGRGHDLAGDHDGAACGDLVSATASAAVELVRRAPLLDAACAGGRTGRRRAGRAERRIRPLRPPSCCRTTPHTFTRIV